MVTFGGINDKGDWIWPKSSRRLARYEKINKDYKKAFLKELKSAFKNDKLNYHLTYEQLKTQIEHVNWVVNNDWPTENTDVIEAYLSKYINRSAISKRRLYYDTDQSEVTITHKDYYNQVQGQAAPYKKTKLSPLLAIDKILQHKLPPHFHRVRYYGLHHSAIEKKVKSQLHPSLTRNKDSTRILFELLTKMINQLNQSPKRLCPNCSHDKFDIQKVAGDPNWVYINVLNFQKNKSPPKSLNTY